MRCKLFLFQRLPVLVFKPRAFSAVIIWMTFEPAAYISKISRTTVAPAGSIV